MNATRDRSDPDVRVPPHSLEAEQSVIGGLLLDNRAWDRIGDEITSGDFYRHEHRVIFDAIAGLMVAGKPVDVITVCERLERAGKADDVGGMPYLNSMAQSVPSAANIRRYAEIVRERAMHRALIAATIEAASIAWDSDDAGEAVDRITSLFGALQRRQARHMPRPISDIVRERLDHYADLEAGRVAPGWPTHFPALDRQLNGGVNPGALHILAARPSVGKSSFVQSMAQAFAADGLPTLFLSMEMTSAEVADRAVSSTGRVSFRAIRTGKMDAADWSRTSEAAETLRRIPLFIDDEGGLSLRAIRAKAKAVKGLKVLIVDYLQLSAPTRRDGNRNAEIGEISRGLKHLAKELDIAVIALSQLNRDVEKRPGNRPVMRDLRDSGEIEQDADVIMFLWLCRDFPESGRKIIGLAVEKTRQGPTGAMALEFRGDMQLWAESTFDVNAVTPRAPRDDL